MRWLFFCKKIYGFVTVLPVNHLQLQLGRLIYGLTTIPLAIILYSVILSIDRPGFGFALEHDRGKYRYWMCAQYPNESTVTISFMRSKFNKRLLLKNLQLHIATVLIVMHINHIFSLGLIFFIFFTTSKTILFLSEAMIFKIFRACHYYIVYWTMVAVKLFIFMVPFT